MLVTTSWCQGTQARTAAECPQRSMASASLFAVSLVFRSVTGCFGKPRSTYGAVSVLGCASWQQAL